MWPNRHSQASAIHDPCCTHCRKQNQTHSTELRQEHAHFGHPVTIVLAVSDSVNDLEVAFQSDYNQTENTGSKTNRSKCGRIEKHANCTVNYGITSVAIAIRKHHDNVAHSSQDGVEIHCTLIDD